MACGHCAAGVDYCVRPWYRGEDEHREAHYPPSHFKKFVVISRDGEPQVWGVRDGEEVAAVDLADPAIHFLVTDDYCEAKAFAAVLAVNER